MSDFGEDRLLRLRLLHLIVNPSTSGKPQPCVPSLTDDPNPTSRDLIFRYLLMPAANGARKIRGRMQCFGVWDDPQAAEGRYLRQRADLEAGRRPRSVDLSEVGASLADVCNVVLTAKSRQHQAGELSIQSLDDYKGTAKRLGEFTNYAGYYADRARSGRRSRVFE